jgi:hypothetical protein
MAFSLKKAGAQPVSQPPAARAMPAIVLNMGVVASASSHLTSVRQFNRYLLLHKLNAAGRRGGKLELLLLEELRHRRTYAGQACAANGGGRQRNLTSRLRFCAVAVSRTSSLAPLKPRSRSRSSLKMRFMFRAERR